MGISLEHAAWYYLYHRSLPGTPFSPTNPAFIMRSLTSSVLTLSLVFGSAQARDNKTKAKGWDLKNFKSIVTFGDSFTDENRLGYFINNKGAAPPVGWEQPIVRH